MAYSNTSLAHKSETNPNATLCKALMRLQETWKYTNAAMAKLLHLKANTYGNWLKSGEIAPGKPPYSPEIEILISWLAIFRSLGAMFQKPEDQVLWLDTPHPHFKKSPALFAQESCENVFYLRHYLDYVRGRGA